MTNLHYSQIITNRAAPTAFGTVILTTVSDSHATQWKFAAKRWWTVSYSATHCIEHLLVVRYPYLLYISFCLVHLFNLNIIVQVHVHRRCHTFVVRLDNQA